MHLPIVRTHTLYNTCTCLLCHFGYALSPCALGANTDRSFVSVLCPDSDRPMLAMPDGQTLRSGRVIGIGESTVSHGSTQLGHPSGPALNELPGFLPSATAFPPLPQSGSRSTCTNTSASAGHWAPSGASAGLPTPLAPSFSSPMPTGVSATSTPTSCLSGSAFLQQGGSQPTFPSYADVANNSLLGLPVPSSTPSSAAPPSRDALPASEVHPATHTSETHTAIPADVLAALELVQRWRRESGEPDEDADSAGEASGLPPVPPRPSIMPDPNLSYNTVSIKSAQIDTIAKLNVGKGESHLNWWFDFSASRVNSRHST